jgi:hypothetical protein
LAVEEKNKKLHWVELGREIFSGKATNKQRKFGSFQKVGTWLLEE